jgi:hypothetical protein
MCVTRIKYNDFSCSDESETRKHQTCRKAMDTRKTSVTPTIVLLPYAHDDMIVGDLTMHVGL